MGDPEERVEIRLLRRVVANPYRSPNARVSDPGQPGDHVAHSRVATSRVALGLAIVAWLTPLLVSAAVLGGVIEGLPVELRWVGLPMDFLAPGYGLFVAVPTALFVLVESWSRGFNARLFTALLLSALYGVAAVGWFYILLAGGW
jgi:hypothetical protein